MRRGSISIEQELSSILELHGVEKARQIAETVHFGQEDKAGAAYINHPRRVAQNTEFFLAYSKSVYTPEEKEIVLQAAWLHDVVEDAADSRLPLLSLEILSDWGVEEDVLRIVNLLTKKEPGHPDPGQCDYYAAIASNKLARLVKIADLTDNSNLERVEAVFKLRGFDKTHYYGKAVETLALDDVESKVFDSRVQLPIEVTNSFWEGSLEELLVPSRNPSQHY